MGGRNDAPTGYAVAGFIQDTTVTRERLTTYIAHRWPDVIGEKIDSTRGEPMPAFLAAN